MSSRAPPLGRSTQRASGEDSGRPHADGRFGDDVNHDFASYHVAACADVEDIEADWIGEIGIVGATAVANAVYHATGIRIRDLPIRPDKLLERLPGSVAATAAVT